jgi:hypothetical protein
LIAQLEQELQPEQAQESQLALAQELAQESQLELQLVQVLE